MMRRPKPFSVSNSPGPQFHGQSSSCDNRSAFDFDPTNTISRFFYLDLRLLLISLLNLLSFCWLKFVLIYLNFSEIQDGVGLWISTRTSALQHLRTISMHLAPPRHKVLKETSPNLTCCLSK